jgi:hypothetical protein
VIEADPAESVRGVRVFVAVLATRPVEPSPVMVSWEIELPRLVGVPAIVIDELTNEELPIADNVFVEPLIALFVSV